MESVTGVTDGRLWGAVLSPQSGEGTGRKEKIRNASFLETVSFVYYFLTSSEQRMSVLGRFHRTFHCNYA